LFSNKLLSDLTHVDGIISKLWLSAIYLVPTFFLLYVFPSQDDRLFNKPKLRHSLIDILQEN